MSTDTTERRLIRTIEGTDGNGAAVRIAEFEVPTIPGGVMPGRAYEVNGRPVIVDEAGAALASLVGEQKTTWHT